MAETTSKVVGLLNRPEYHQAVSVLQVRGVQLHCGYVSLVFVEVSAQRTEEFPESPSLPANDGVSVDSLADSE